MDLKERKLINNTKNDLPKFGLGTTIAQEYADDEYNEALLSGELGPNPNKAGATALFNDQMAQTGVKPKQNMFKSMIGDTFSKDTLEKAGTVGIGVASNIIGNTAKNLIGGDNESTVGNVLGRISNQLNSINPLFGFGGNILAGGLNALFGSNKKKEQEEKLRRARLQREQELANVRDEEWSSKINNDFMQKYGDLDAQQSLYGAHLGVHNFNNVLNKFTKKDHLLNTAFGQFIGRGNAKVEKDELIVSDSGSMYVVPFGKNDSAYAYLGDGDSVYSPKNKDPFTGLKMTDAAPLYVAQGRKDFADFAQDLGKYMKYFKHNNMYASNENKIPKYKNGTSHYDPFLGNLITTGYNFYLADKQKETLRDALRYPNAIKYAQNKQLGSGLSKLNSLRMDFYPVIAQNKNTESATRYNINRSGAISSTGQKMLLNRQLAYDTQRNNADVFFKNALQNNQYRQLAAQEAIRAGQDVAAAAMRGYMFDEDRAAGAHNSFRQGNEMVAFNQANTAQKFHENAFNYYLFDKTMKKYEKEQEQKDKDRRAKANNISTYSIPSGFLYNNMYGGTQNGLYNPFGIQSDLYKNQFGMQNGLYNPFGIKLFKNFKNYPT